MREENGVAQKWIRGRSSKALPGCLSASDGDRAPGSHKPAGHASKYRNAVLWRPRAHNGALRQVMQSIELAQSTIFTFNLIPAGQRARASPVVITHPALQERPPPSIPGKSDRTSAPGSERGVHWQLGCRRRWCRQPTCCHGVDQAMMLAEPHTQAMLPPGRLRQASWRRPSHDGPRPPLLPARPAPSRVCAAASGLCLHPGSLLRSRGAGFCRHMGAVRWVQCSASTLPLQTRLAEGGPPAAQPAGVVRCIPLHGAPVAALASIPRDLPRCCLQGVTST